MLPTWQILVLRVVGQSRGGHSPTRSNLRLDAPRRAFLAKAPRVPLATQIFDCARLPVLAVRHRPPLRAVPPRRACGFLVRPSHLCLTRLWWVDPRPQAPGRQRGERTHWPQRRQRWEWQRRQRVHGVAFPRHCDAANLPFRPGQSLPVHHSRRCGVASSNPTSYQPGRSSQGRTRMGNHSVTPAGSGNSLTPLGGNGSGSCGMGGRGCSGGSTRAAGGARGSGGSWII